VSAADHLRVEGGEGGGVYKQDSVRGRERVYPDESDEVEAGGINFKSNAKERKQQRRMRVLSKAIRMFPHPYFVGNLRTDFVFRKVGVVNSFSPHFFLLDFEFFQN